jgi:2-polyprenyl-3-methyl-5-hydroxy-6-metoxy-1,4-benzoquinol methylase
MLKINNILKLNKNQGLQFFLELLKTTQVSNSEKLVQSANNVLSKGSDVLIEQIKSAWYASVKNKQPNYNLYNIDEYLVEVWICYEMYSKKYLKEIKKPNSLPPYGIYEENKNAKLIVDLGNGIGTTSVALKQMFPDSVVIGTNVLLSTQYKMAKILSELYDFQMVNDVNKIKQQPDLVFASEYFEHFEDPVAHLLHIVKSVKPKRWLIASTFNGVAIGHFTSYLYNGEEVNGVKISRLFNNALRDLGYKKIQTKLWNNRPSYWKLDA